MKLTQGKIVKWVNKKNQQILWMVTEDTTKGIVLHSEGLLTVGAITDLSDIELTGFIGTVNISSAAS